MHALLAPGFDLSRHPLSLLALGDTGWIQTANFILAGLMVTVAAVGFGRSAAPAGRARWLSGLVGLYGLCVLTSGVFRADPMPGFPPGSTTAEVSTNGMLHLAVGALGFVALGVAVFVFAAWARPRHSGTAATLSVVAGIIIVAGFAGRAVLSTTSLGVPSLWTAVVCGFAWLAAASIYAWRTIPHPDGDRR